MGVEGAQPTGIARGRGSRDRTNAATAAAITPNAAARAAAAMARRFHFRALVPRVLPRWLAVLGPGLLAMAGDNDAGGLLSYAATGARFGAGAFVLLLLPLCACAFVVQDTAMRVGAATGRGLGALVRTRFSRSWAVLCGCDLAVQNWLTLVTEFAGMGVGLAHFGVPLRLGVPLSCALVLGLVLLYPYRTAERLGVGLAVASLLFLPLAAGAGLHGGPSVWGPRPGPGLRLFLVAAVGNALAPWMIFFQAQGSAARAEADGRAQGRAAPDAGRPSPVVAAGRWDLGAGSSVQVAVAAAVVVLGAAGVGAAGGGARGLAGDLFAVGLFDAGLVAALTVSLSTAWAVTEVFGGTARPGTGALGAPAFFGAYAAGLVAAAGAVLLPGLSPTLVAVVVQAASAVLLPPIIALLLVLANDAHLMGQGRNTPAWNVAGCTVLGLFTAACLWLLVGGGG